jgi:hypothetical protein
MTIFQAPLSPRLVRHHSRPAAATTIFFYPLPAAPPGHASRDALGYTITASSEKYKPLGKYWKNNHITKKYGKTQYFLKVLSILP